MSKISIIIPVYNVEKYISECLNSVINQTLKEIEIILINDGSTDNSGKICEEYASKDNRIKVIHQENKGASFSRNIGIEKARGEYIYFIDSDDFLENIDFLENAYNNGIQNNSDLVIVSFDTLFFKNKKIKDITNLYTWNCFVKRDFLIKNKEVKFSETMDFSEDAIFSFKVLLLAKEITQEKKAHYFYRKRKNQITQKKIELKKVMTNILKEIEKFYNSNNFWQIKQKELLLFTVEHNFKLFIDKRVSLKEKEETRNLIKQFLKIHKMGFYEFLKINKGFYLIIFYYCPFYFLIDIGFTFSYLFLFFTRKIIGKNVNLNWNYLWRKII